MGAFTKETHIYAWFMLNDSARENVGPFFTLKSI